MKEYIEREVAKKEFALNFGSVRHAVIANRLLDSIPAADVAPVVHGRWEEKSESYFGLLFMCSACGEEFCFIEGAPSDNLYNYCPNCGARMDGTGDV